MKNKTKVACGIIPIFINKVGTREFLLIKSHHGKIAFPKGHMDPGETFLETAKRELLEEVGISDIEIDENKMVTETYYFDQGDTCIKKVVHMFPGFVSGKQVTIQDEEVSQYYWLSEKNALEKITFKEQKDSFKKMVMLLG